MDELTWQSLCPQIDFVSGTVITEIIPGKPQQNFGIYSVWYNPSGPKSDKGIVLRLILILIVWNVLRYTKISAMNVIRSS